jgi:hypothetical protein
MVAYRPPPSYLQQVIPVPFLMPIPPAPPKRPNNEEEESSNAPRKKPRTSRAKADGSVGKCLAIPEGEPFSQKSTQPPRGDTPLRKGVKQRRLPHRTVGPTVSPLHPADDYHDLTEMMASVAYQPQQTGGEKLTDS